MLNHTVAMNSPEATTVPPTQFAKQQLAESQAKASAEKLRSAQDVKKLAKIEHVNAVAKVTIGKLRIDLTSPRNLRKLEREARIALNEARQNKEELQRELKFALSDEEEFFNKYLQVREVREDAELRFEQAKEHLKIREHFSKVVQGATTSQDKDSLKAIQANLLNEFDCKQDIDEWTEIEIERTKDQLKKANAIARAAEDESYSANRTVLIEQAVTDTFLSASSPREARAMARDIRSDNKDSNSKKNLKQVQLKRDLSGSHAGNGLVTPVRSSQKKKSSHRGGKQQQRVAFSEEIIQRDIDRKWMSWISISDLFMVTVILILATMVYCTDEKVAIDISEMIQVAFCSIFKSTAVLLTRAVSNFHLAKDTAFGVLQDSKEMIQGGYSTALMYIKTIYLFSEDTIDIFEMIQVAFCSILHSIAVLLTRAASNLHFVKDTAFGVVKDSKEMIQGGYSTALTYIKTIYLFSEDSSAQYVDGTYLNATMGNL